MATQRLSLQEIREVLRLRALGRSPGAIAQSLRIGQNTVQHYVGRAEASGAGLAAAAQLGRRSARGLAVSSAPRGRYNPTGPWLANRFRWLKRDHPSASASLPEGLSEVFTIKRLGLSLRLRKCPGSTKLIDSTHSGVRQMTRRVTHWKNGAMALRWAAASFVETEKSYRRIIGYDQLWMLRAHLDDHEPVAEMRKAG